ncbi:MAG: helix-turn-helix domain-containing protein [Candidatus Omnitrophota bacterium]
MKKMYIVDLTNDEQKKLKEIISSGKHSAKKIRRAHILLKANEGWTDAKISKALTVDSTTVERIRKQFVEESFENTINGRKSKRVYKRKLDGKQEAHLIAIACGESPEGSVRWTLHMLADKMVQLGYVENISHETVRKTLKKTN